jgi:hypothetical protein
MEDEKIRLSQKEVKTFNALKGIGGVHFPVFKDNTNYYKLPLSEIEELVNRNKVIKDNARDSVTDPVRPDNITDIEQLTFVRNVGADANYAMVESEERGYGVLIPPPSMEADYDKVPMYKAGNQIEWERVDSGVTTTVSEITENTNVTLVAGQNRYMNCTNSPTISVEIADNNIYHIQINGSCTLALTGVSWGGDAITAITTKAEISILNGIAVGVLYE